MARLPPPLAQVLGNADPLSRLREHADRLTRLQRLVHALLPEQTRTAIQVANLQQGSLTLHAASPAVATRLKQSLPSLLAALQAQGELVDEIKLKVRAGGPLIPERPREVINRQVPKSGQDALKKLQEDVRADSPLAKALKELIERTG